MYTVRAFIKAYAKAITALLTTFGTIAVGKLALHWPDGTVGLLASVIVGAAVWGVPNAQKDAPDPPA